MASDSIANTLSGALPWLDEFLVTSCNYHKHVRVPRDLSSCMGFGLDTYLCLSTVDDHAYALGTCVNASRNLKVTEIRHVATFAPDIALTKISLECVFPAHILALTVGGVPRVMQMLGRMDPDIRRRLDEELSAEVGSDMRIDLSKSLPGGPWTYHEQFRAVDVGMNQLFDAEYVADCPRRFFLLFGSMSLEEEISTMRVEQAHHFVAGEHRCDVFTGTTPISGSRRVIQYLWAGVDGKLAMFACGNIRAKREHLAQMGPHPAFLCQCE